MATIAFKPVPDEPTPIFDCMCQTKFFDYIVIIATVSHCFLYNVCMHFLQRHNNNATYDDHNHNRFKLYYYFRLCRQLVSVCVSVYMLS